MRIYRCNFYDASMGQQVSWHGSKREAEQHLRVLQTDRGEPAAGPEGVQPVELPTKRKLLLGWLNTHFNTDNG